jgi:hypothetical protein
VTLDGTCQALHIVTLDRGDEAVREVVRDLLCQTIALLPAREELSDHVTAIQVMMHDLVQEVSRLDRVGARRFQEVEQPTFRSAEPAEGHPVVGPWRRCSLRGASVVSAGHDRVAGTDEAVAQHASA